MKRIDALTGLRGIAALWVILYHVHSHAYFHFIQFGFLNPIVSKGYLAVDLFFILSGFVISYVHQSEFLSLNGPTTLRFLGLRLARIMPVHLLMLAIYAVFLMMTTWILHIPPDHPKAFSGNNFILNIFLLHAWGFADMDSWNAPSWSISAEWFAYLVFPLITLALSRLAKPSQSLGVIVILTLSLTGAFYFVGDGTLNWSFHHALIRVFTEFTMGCCLFNVFKHAAPKAFAWDGLSCPILIIILAGLFLRLPDLAVVLGEVMLVYSLCHAQGFLRTALTNRWILALGERSFSIYMVHNLMMTLFKQGLSWSHYLQYRSPLLDGLMLIGFIISVYLIAHVIYQAVEVPSRKALRNILRQYLPDVSTSPLAISPQ